MRLDGGKFHGLVFVHELSHGMTAQEDQNAGDQTGERSHLERALEEFHVLLADEVPGADRQDQERCHRQTVGDGMPEEDPPLGIADQGEEVHQFRAAVGLVDHISHRMLHPAVGEQDPERGQVGTERNQPDRSEMHFFRNFSFTEDPNAEER